MVESKTTTNREIDRCNFGLSLASDRRRRGREVLAWNSSTCSEFVKNPCDEDVRAVPHRLERPAEGGGDLLTGPARDEMPQN